VKLRPPGNALISLNPDAGWRMTVRRHKS